METDKREIAAGLLRVAQKIQPPNTHMHADAVLAEGNSATGLSVESGRIEGEAGKFGAAQKIPSTNTHMHVAATQSEDNA